MDTIPREHFNLYYIFLEEREQRRLAEDVAARIWDAVRTACVPSS